MPSFQDIDVLVIGSGLAGCRAALQAQSRGCRCVVVSPQQPGYCGNSSRASGGFATAIGPIDSPSKHALDIITGGYGLSDPDLVRLVTSQAPERFSELAEIAPDFIREKDGFTLYPVPAHSLARSIQYQSGTSNLMQSVARKCSTWGVEFLTSHLALSLLVNERGETCGALIVNLKTLKTHQLSAQCIVLASGGCAPLYPVNSNDPNLFGSSYALALEAGCQLRDMEFIQFTPTAFAYPATLRGHTIVGTLLTLPGVTLTNRHGHRFMVDYDPARMEQTDRATLARAIHQEVIAGNGTENDGVYLDLRSVSTKDLDCHRPGFSKLCRDHHVNPEQELLQTAPSAHTCLGGISVDLTMQARPGLYAAGEAIGGLHGANRLASNSLMEANVTGAIAGQSAAKYVLGKSSRCLPVESNGSPVLDSNDLGLRQQLKNIMGKYAGVSRNRDNLIKGIQEIENLVNSLKSKSPAISLESYLMKQQLLTANVIMESALGRNESRGAHYRSDHKHMDDKNSNGSWFVKLTDQKPEYTFKSIV